MKATARRFCVCYYLYSVVVLLLSLRYSIATYNPAYHPQHAQQYPSYPQDDNGSAGYKQNVNWDGTHPRGGSTMVAPEPPAPEQVYGEPPAQEESFTPPKIHLKHMSMALRLTSEWNRRLINGVNRFRFWGKKTTTTGEDPSASHSEQDWNQGFGKQPVNVHPSRPWHPPIREGKPEPELELTVFHAKTPRGGDNDPERRGVARWGPELLPYLEHVVNLLGVTEDGVEVPLAMIYLDRACSVETPRSNGVPHCPFCTPRTVHRLSLVALLLASEVVNGGDDGYLEKIYVEKLQSLGIPLSQLQQMVDWMRGALGDSGLLVTIGQMKLWSQTWDSIFFPRQRQEQLEKVRQQQQMLQQQYQTQHHNHQPSPQIHMSQPYQ